MDNSIIGFVVFIAAYIAGRMISERALRKLDTEQQGRLVRGFSAYRIVSLVGIILLVLLHYAARTLAADGLLASMAVFVGVLVAYLLLSSIYAFVKLKKLEMPETYINQYLISTLIQYVGIFVFFGYLINT
jgi:hypothetical protein